MRRPLRRPSSRPPSGRPGGRQGKGQARVAFLAHALAHGWRGALEIYLEEAWTCCSCEVVFRPTIMMILQDHDNWRNCPSCEGLLLGSFRTRTPSWFTHRDPDNGEGVNHAKGNSQAT